MSEVYIVGRLRERLGSVEVDAMRGDNLAVTLASIFEPWIEDDEMDDSGTWKQGAIDAMDQVLDAIHAHYIPALDAERTARTAAEAGAATLKAYALEATKAITGLTVGGSEFFGARIGDMYTADLPFCVAHIRERLDSAIQAKLAVVAAERRATAAKAEIARCREVLEKAPRRPEADPVAYMDWFFEVRGAALEPKP